MRLDVFRCAGGQFLNDSGVLETVPDVEEFQGKRGKWYLNSRFVQAHVVVEPTWLKWYRDSLIFIEAKLIRFSKWLEGLK